MNAHQNQWQVRELVKQIGRFHYDVDVIDHDDKDVTLTKKYDLIIDLHPGLNNCYFNYMNIGCQRVAYLTGMNASVANHAEDLRMSALAKRRGVRLPPERHARLISKEIENFDACWYIGNSYNFKSYDEFQMPSVSFIKNTGYKFSASFDKKKKSMSNFLFFASSGQVHKGLDLLLEIFGQKNFPYSLYICSSFRNEHSFCELYEKELFHRKNIHPVGFIDIHSKLFLDITDSCAFTILPSCSEGIAGSVLTAMSAGLIPLVSRECGFEDDEVISLDDCSIPTIEQAIREYGEKDINWIIKKSNEVKQIVQERYSEEMYRASIRSALERLLGTKKEPLV
ncbi:glycosyltransferase [Selenomonas artemidis]|uniref:glycosyltransferase n=1 Tax=Selenomonas artemidis TaxID=671224 RepID=UPI002889AD22|nr:glycosyltransferase [Selenomonas artemidis]